MGLFGGSFDPVHNGHLALARVAVAHLQLDELRWVPAGQPWQKQRELAPADHRTAMIALTIEGDPRQRLDLCEVQRSGPSYTLDTVRALQSGEPAAEWFLLIGQDQYARFHTWHQRQELLERLTLAVAARGGQHPEPGAPLAVVSHRVVGVPMPRLDVSSSDIRARLSLGQDISGMVPATVARYIDQHCLYRETSRS